MLQRCVRNGRCNYELLTTGCSI